MKMNTSITYCYLVLELSVIRIIVAEFPRYEILHLWKGLAGGSAKKKKIVSRLTYRIVYVLFYPVLFYPVLVDLLYSQVTTAIEKLRCKVQLLGIMGPAWYEKARSTLCVKSRAQERTFSLF